MATGTKRIPRAIREQQMLDSAIRVFSDLGYRSASMDAIARDAKISKPMLYLYYGSKEELFAACVSRESERLIELLHVAASRKGGARQRLEKVVESFLEFVDTHADSWNVVYRQAVAEPAFRQSVEATRTVLVGLTTKLLEYNARTPRDLQVLEVVAIALVGAGEAVADQVASRSTPRAEAAAIVVDLAWRGLSVNASDAAHTAEKPRPSTSKSDSTSTRGNGPT